MDKFYPIAVVAIAEADGGGYIGFAPDLKGCMSHGDTPEEAFASTQDAVLEWIEEAKALGRTIPEPGSGAAKSKADREKLVKTMKEQQTAFESLSADVHKLQADLRDLSATLDEATEQTDTPSWTAGFIPAAVLRKMSEDSNVH
jgi:antitoxin HicB